MAILRFPLATGGENHPRRCFGFLYHYHLIVSPNLDRAVEVVYVPSERASIQHLAVTKNFTGA